MPIVCGTDFTESAARAADAAGALARRLGTPLHLVHVLAGLGDERLLGSPQEALLEPMKARLEAEAGRLRQGGAEVETTMAAGAPDEVLVEHAARAGAEAIVVGSLGRRAPARWLLGSTAERTATSAGCAVLVLRGDDPLGPFLRGERPLRVMLGADYTAATEAAARSAAKLLGAGPCELHVVQVVWPPEVHGRFGLHAPADLVRLGAQASELLVRELRERLEPLLPGAEVRYHLVPSMGRPADNLIDRARREGVDLLVVGTHQRRGLERLRSGSTSTLVLRGAPMSVACVPPQAAPERELGPVHAMRVVLVPTDLSPLADRAVLAAYGMLPHGGTVRLVHVVERAVTNPVYAYYGIGTVAAGDDAKAQRRALAEHLRGLVPPEAEELGIATEVEVIESSDPGAAIHQAAERASADAICMGTHGRSGVAKAVLGSVAQAVLARTRRPLLLVKPPEA